MFSKLKKFFSKGSKPSEQTQDEPLVPVIMPALSSILISAEDKKGAPLTLDEVNDIRDDAPAVMLPISAIQKMAESRGYEDIDPRNAWYDWQILRREMGRKPDIDPGIRKSFTDNNDPAYQATVTNAQKTLKAFKDKIGELPHATHMLKTIITDGEESSYLWLNDVKISEDNFIAAPFEVPTTFKTIIPGDKINVKPADVLDWMIIDDGIAHGGYSIRFLRSQKRLNEQLRYDEFLGIKKYMPLPEI